MTFSLWSLAVKVSHLGIHLACPCYASFFSDRIFGLFVHALISHWSSFREFGLVIVCFHQSFSYSQ
jgi:hypothetical protein